MMIMMMKILQKRARDLVIGVHKICVHPLIHVQGRRQKIF